MKSSLDRDVAESIKNKEHRWETVSDHEFCTRCGKKKDHSRLPDGTFLPCKGFI